MKTIIVATDFSPAASNAARYGMEMALSLHANLFLVHVYQLPPVYFELPVAYAQEDMRKEAEQEMDRLKACLKLRSEGKLNISTEVTTGTFFPELQAVCERLQPYVVVMGAQGTSAGERFFIGGHAVYAMKHLSWPVITVPPGASYSSVAKIGLACDFDHVLDTIPVEEIKGLVKEFNATLYVINTGKREKYDPQIVFESGMLEEMLAPVKPHYQFITNGDTDEAIMYFVNKAGIDLLILLPKRHSLIEKLVHRSHTRNIVLRSHVPVMAIHF